MWVVLGIYYGLIIWLAALLYALIVGVSIILTIAIAPFVVSSVTLIVCAVGVFSDWVRRRRKAG